MVYIEEIILLKRVISIVDNKLSKNNLKTSTAYKKKRGKAITKPILKFSALMIIIFIKKIDQIENYFSRIISLSIFQVFIWIWQDMLVIFIQAMGGVCSVVEAIVSTGMIAQGIAEAVLKAKIKDLLDAHQEEFQIMDQLNQFLDKLLSQQNLVAQLNANVLFATDNWNTIFDDLEDKNDLLQKIIDKFPNVKPSDFSYSFTDGLTFSISILAFGYMMYNFISGNAKASITSDINAFKEFCKNSAAKIRGTAPEIKSGKVNQDGTIEIQSHGTNAENVPAQTRESEVEQVKTQEKTGGSGEGWKGKAITGLRLIFIAVAVYGFVQGVIGLEELNDQYNKYVKYFSEGGQFDEAEDGVIHLMNLIASDIFTLANCARAAVFDSKIMFLVRSITLPRYTEETLNWAKELDADKLGLTQQFISSSNDLINSVNSVSNSGKTRKEKLQDLQTYFKSFFDNQKPDSILLQCSIELSQVVGKFSIISGNINDDQHNVNRFLTYTSEVFQDMRDQFFDKQSPEEKQKTDTEILNKCFNKYSLVFDIEDMTIDTLDQDTKDVLFHAMVSFCDSFFYDDLTGATLFTKNISQGKAEANYAQILQQELSKANVVPVRLEKDEDQQNAIKQWLDMANQENEKEGSKYWQAGDNLKGNFRYIRLEVQESTDSDGNKVGTLGSFEGIQFEVKKEFYSLERSVTQGTITLAKILS